MRSLAQPQQALCCQCGNIRTYKQARNTVGDCFADLRTWHRMVGDLKCAHCETITRHALLRPANCDYRDYAEEFTRMALGGKPTDRDRLTDVDRIRRQYRMGLPRNPYLFHCYWLRDTERARAAGVTTITAMCGETVPLPPERHCRKSRFGPTGAGYEAPRELSEIDREDPQTGLSWFDQACRLPSGVERGLVGIPPPRAVQAARGCDFRIEHP